MRNTLLALLLACLFLPTIPATTLATTPFAAAEYSSQIRRRRSRRARVRFVIHRRSGRVRTALCRDGRISLSRHHRGTCSGHGGVRRWLR
jgi:hypothetical protein